MFNIGKGEIQGFATVVYGDQRENVDGRETIFGGLLNQLSKKLLKVTRFFFLKNNNSKVIIFNIKAF